MLNQGRPLIEGRAKRSPNRKGSRPGMGRARAGVSGEGLAGWLICWLDGRFYWWMKGPWRGFIARAVSERSEHRWSLGGKANGFAGRGQGSWADGIWNWGAPALQAGAMLRNMSGANTDLFWSVKSLLSGMEHLRNGKWQSLNGGIFIFFDIEKIDSIY